MKPIDCQIRGLVREDGGVYRTQQDVTLEPVLSTPYQFGNFRGDLIVNNGHYCWNIDHYFLIIDTVDGQSFFGVYMLCDGAAYVLSRCFFEDAHAAQDYTIEHLGTPLVEHIKRIDGLDLHPACME